MTAAPTPLYPPLSAVLRLAALTRTLPCADPRVMARIRSAVSLGHAMGWSAESVSAVAYRLLDWGCLHAALARRGWSAERVRTATWVDFVAVFEGRVSAALVSAA